MLSQFLITITIIATSAVKAATIPNTIHVTGEAAITKFTTVIAVLNTVKAAATPRTIAPIVLTKSQLSISHVRTLPILVANSVSASLILGAYFCINSFNIGSIAESISAPNSLNIAFIGVIISPIFAMFSLSFICASF